MSDKATVRQADSRGRVVLPKQFAGKDVTVTRVSENEVVVRMAKPVKRPPHLPNLLRRITEENLNKA